MRRGAHAPWAGFGGGSLACACDRCSRAARCHPGQSTRSRWTSSCHSPAAPGPRHHLRRQAVQREGGGGVEGEVSDSDRATNNH